MAQLCSGDVTSSAKSCMDCGYVQSKDKQVVCAGIKKLNGRFQKLLVTLLTNTKSSYLLRECFLLQSILITSFRVDKAFNPFRSSSRLLSDFDLIESLITIPVNKHQSNKIYTTVMKYIGYGRNEY